MKIFLQIISGLLTTSFLFAQENIKIDALRFYGKLRVHSFLFDNNIELNINSIRSVNKRGFSQKNIYFNDSYTLMRYALGLNYHMNSNDTRRCIKPTSHSYTILSYHCTV